jgi:mannosyltransferase PIG-V
MTATRSWPRSALISVVGIWLAWAVALLAFQSLVPGRISLERPDDVLEWTADETELQSHSEQPNLLDPTFAGQVAWDSEFYISIAAVGYDDPNVRTMRPDDGSARLSLNYAFMPLYPTLMRVVAAPLGAFGLNSIATAVIAGVAISLLSALAAMVALFSLARRYVGASGGIRAATYLVAFPTGFFLAQVYTEALFLALALGCLALLAERRILPAAGLAVLAVWTRPIGIALIIPIALAVIEPIWRERRTGGTATTRSSRDLVIGAGAIAAPLVAYAIWALSPLGSRFAVVEREYFGQQLLAVGPSWSAWTSILGGLGHASTRTQIYYGLEISAIALAVVATVWALRRAPGIALFGLVALLVPLSGGAPQSIIRYVLAVPAVFLLLARLGEHPAFDRAWLIASTLVMGFLAMLFTFDFWVA